MKKRVSIALPCAVTIGGLAIWWLAAGRFHREAAVPASPAAAIPTASSGANRAQAEGRLAVLADDAPCVPENLESDGIESEAEKLASEEEAKVEAFDALTDGWMEPSENGVSMRAVEIFVETFRNVPEDRQAECVQRALNLIPDENIVLLTGLLLDKRVSKDVAELIFNDILNRDDAVKSPILHRIHEDRSHSCWEDANWILDYSGGLSPVE